MIRRPARIALAALCALAVVSTAYAARPHHAGRAGYHGAIAVHAATKAVGYSYDFRTAREARVAALAECGHAQCEVVVAVTNGCAAAVISGTKVLHATGATRAEAETKATKGCSAKSGCAALAWTCTK